MSVSTLGGLLFLVGGVVVFVLGIVLISARDRSTRTPRRTVTGFQRSRRALSKIHRAEEALRKAARARARALHPSGRRRGGKKSA